MTASRWPLHPVPEKYEMLHCWVQRLAAAYGVPMPVFCRRALGLERQEIHLLRHEPPMSALLALEAGSGIPVEQLQNMTIWKVFARITQDLEEAMRRDPEGFDMMFGGRLRASQSGR